jgi:hypothetical protein
MRVQTLRTLFIGMVLAAAAFLLLTSQGLPDRVASNFAASGRAHAYMSRSAYLWMMGILITVIPLIMLVAFSWLPKRFPQLINVPNRSDWLAPEKRGELFEKLDKAGLFIAATVVVFMTAMHWLIFEANEFQPPRLAYRPFFLLLGVFIAVTVGFAIWMSLQFRSKNLRSAK